MSLFFRERAAGDSLSDVVPGRNGGTKGSRPVSPERAMSNSAVWAGLRVRADLISSLPVDLYRGDSSAAVEISKPQVLTEPGATFVGGERVDVAEWLWASQVDLDRYGNAFGRIVEFDSMYRPKRIDLLAADSVTVRLRDGVVSYLVDGKKVDAAEIWHERQYPVPGLPVGLSPIAYAALTLNTHRSAVEFAASWFSGQHHPAGVLKNVKRRLTPGLARAGKDRYRESTSAGDVLVVGADWDYEVKSVPEATSQFIEQQQWGDVEMARYIGVPADVIDAVVQGSNITYANVTQRMLQLLVVNLSSPIGRRERALSKLTPKPQTAKLNTGALLRLDPAAQTDALAKRAEKRVLTPDEWRALDNRAPLTQDDLDQMAAVWGDPNRKPTQQGGQTS